jgi:hypothetical protein
MITTDAYAEIQNAINSVMKHNASAPDNVLDSDLERKLNEEQRLAQKPKDEKGKIEHNKSAYNNLIKLDKKDLISVVNENMHLFDGGNLKYHSGKIEPIPASEYILGKGVLGVAFMYKKVIMFLDRFYGPLKDKIIDHEETHLKKPHESEQVVRYHTDTKDVGVYNAWLN